MATTHKARFSVSMTPVVTVDAVAGASLETNSLHEDVRKTVGGSGEVTYNGAIDYGGWSDGTPTYLSATSGGVTVGNTDTQLLYIEHTGYEYSSGTVLGDATSGKVSVLIDLEIFARLSAGESIVIPVNGASSGTYRVSRVGSPNKAIIALGLD